MPNISFQYPAWFLLFCALLGLGYAMLLYFRDTTFREKSPRLNFWLGALRWLAVTILSALLLSPLLKSVLRETKKPIIVLAQDHSESVGTLFDSNTLQQYRSDFFNLKNSLSENFEVHDLAFGDAVREGANFQFTDKVTNLSEVMQGVYDLFGTQNLGAVVIASDGIFNEGANPAYSGVQFAAPIFTVALGDTTPKKDLLVKRVFHNKIAYLGDRFTIQIDVAANNCAGTQTVLNIGKVEGEGVKNLQSIPISVAGNDFFITREVQLEADKAGVAQYLISVAKVPGEASVANNTKEIFIDVLDARQKILLLANAPHPDLSALRQTLETNKNYDVSVAMAGDAGLDVSKFDFVVLHNLPSAAHDLSGVLPVLNTRRIPRFFVAGMQTNFTALNQAQDLVTMQSDGRQSDDVQAKLVPQFASFTLNPRVAEELPKFNPVTSPFGNFSASNKAQVILRKRIGKIDTEQPLLAVGETSTASGSIKTGVFLGEGWWKWRLFDFMQHQNQEIFDELLGKTVQFLSLKEDKRKFRVSLEKNIFNENEPVMFSAELYNDNYELINEPDVAVVARHRDGKEYTYTFNRLGKGYTLNAGILPTGNYTFQATTQFNGQNLVAEGQFSVRPIELELFETTANHAVLRQLSQKFGGSTVSAAQMTSLADLIKNQTSIKPVIYETAKTRSVINLKWIFALLAVLLAVEWFLRRYFGAY